jgi:hypothetical protein
MDRCFVEFGLLMQSDLDGDSKAHYNNNDAKLYDEEHIQTMMIQELEEGRTYFLDLIDDELANNAVKAILFKSSKDYIPGV